MKNKVCSKEKKKKSKRYNKRIEKDKKKVSGRNKMVNRVLCGTQTPEKQQHRDH